MGLTIHIVARSMGCSPHDRQSKTMVSQPCITKKEWYITRYHPNQLLLLQSDDQLSLLYSNWQYVVHCTLLNIAKSPRNTQQIISHQVILWIPVIIRGVTLQLTRTVKTRNNVLLTIDISCWVPTTTSIQRVPTSRHHRRILLIHRPSIILMRPRMCTVLTGDRQGRISISSIWLLDCLVAINKSNLASS